MTTARILVVEDHAIVAKDIENKLQQVGYVVLGIAFSGEEAIQQAAETQPDLVLMDIRLPGEMEGIEAAEEIQARFDIPVVYLTAYADEETVERAKVSEPFGYILKPFEARELRGAIEVALYKHEMDRRLRESEARYRAVSELTSDFTYAFGVESDGTLVVEWMTEAFSRITGFALDEVETGGDWMSIVHPDDRPAVLQRLQAVLSGQPDRYELRIVTKSGETRWVHVYSRPVWDEAQGRVVRIIGAAQDITERKRAEEALQRLYEQAQRDAEIKATLLDEVNHRVKNNLLAIVGLLYAERRYAERTDQVAYRAITRNLMNRVGGLITVHSLLAASDWAPLLLSNLAGQVVHASLQMLPRHKGVSVEVTPSPVRVTADQAHSLALVINELAANTVKHALEERDTAHVAVRIALEDEDDTVRFEFRDDGPGYPEDVLGLERYRVGFDLIQNMVRTGLRGELSLYNDDGAVAVIRFKTQA